MTTVKDLDYYRKHFGFGIDELSGVDMTKGRISETLIWRDGTLLHRINHLESAEDPVTWIERYVEANGINATNLQPTKENGDPAE